MKCIALILALALISTPALAGPPAFPERSKVPGWTVWSARPHRVVDGPLIQPGSAEANLVIMMVHTLSADADAFLTRLRRYAAQRQPAVRGRGVDRALAQRLVADARTEGFKIAPVFLFINNERRKHPDWSGVFA